MAGVDDYMGSGSLRNELGYYKQNTSYSSNEFERYRAPEAPVSNTEDVTTTKYIGSSLGVISLIAESLLSHPFVVLRRQCQVHNNSKKFHLVPISLVPVIYRLHQHQGLTTLWKGLGSSLLVRGLSLGVEDVISKTTPWPKEIHKHCSVKSFLQHTMLKCVSFAVITPFYSASLVETVQSDVASEKPGLFDIFYEGSVRLLNCGGAKGRMVPLWALVLPTVTLGITRYFFSLLIKNCSFLILNTFKARKTNPALEQATHDVSDIELNSSLISIIATDIIFYPFETILHRLHLQGTRTIIDNLDTGRSVLAILTNYDSLVDCYNSCLNNEGFLGFYKGFGALILQYVAHIAVVHVTRLILTEVSGFLKKRKAPQPPSTTQF